MFKVNPRSWFFVFLLILTAMLVILPATNPVYADTPTPTSTPLPTWTHTFDFSTGDHGWAPGLNPSDPFTIGANTTYISGQGFKADSACYLSDGFGSAAAYIEWDARFITRIRYTYEAYVPSGVGTRGLFNGLLTNTHDISTTSSPEYGDETFPSTDMSGIAVLLQFRNTDRGATGPCSGWALLSSVTIDGLGDDPFIADSTPTPTPSPTSGPIAPATCDTPFDVKYDFTDGLAHDWIGNPGAPDSDGFTAGYTDVPGGGGSAVYLILSRALGSGSSLSNADLDIDYRPGSSGSEDLRQIKAAIGSTTLIDAGAPPPSGRRTYSWSGSQAAGLLTFTLYASGKVGFPDGYLTVKSIRLRGNGYSPDGQCTPKDPLGNTESGAWAFPISSGQKVSGPFPLNQNKNTVYPSIAFKIFGGNSESAYDSSKTAYEWLSTNSDTNVHSVTNGTVASVVSAVSDGDPCAFPSAYYALVGQPNSTCTRESLSNVYAVEYSSAFIVTISSGNNITLTYIVNNPNVQQGQTVKQGCILGKALPYSTFRIGSSPSIGLNWDQSQQGYITVQAKRSGVPLDIVPYLQEEPLNIYCGQATQAGGCTLVYNATFDAPATEWGGAKNPVGQDTGLLLVTSARQTLNLDTTKSYTVTVKSHLANPTNDVRIDFNVQLGTSTATNIQVRSLSSETTVIPAATYTPTDTNGRYDLTISSTPNTRSNVVVDFICVSDDDGLPPLASECILANHEFDTSGNWTPGTTGSGTDVSIHDGMAWIGNLSYITQQIKLSPASSGSQSYDITIKARRQGVSVSGQSVSVAWTITGSSGGTGGSLNGLTDQTWKTGSGSFSVSTSGTYEVKLAASATGGSSQSLQIDSICIGTSDGSSPPGYQPAPPIPFTVQCKICVYGPTGDLATDAPELVSWLFCGISQIWHCQAKTILLGIWTAILSILTFLGQMRLWMSYTITDLIQWANGNALVLARWFNAQFINATTQLTEAIQYGPRTSYTVSGNANVFDVLVSFFSNGGSVLNSIVNAITTGITSIRDILLSLLDKLYSLITLILNLLATIIHFVISVVMLWVNTALNIIGIFMSAIVSAINAPPQVPAGLPVCDTSAAMIPESCVNVFILDNTLFAEGSVVNAVMPLVYGGISFSLIWWAIYKFRDAITEAG